MTHNVTLPLRSCLYTRLREEGRERQRGWGGTGRERGSGRGRGDEGHRIKVVGG